MTTKDFNDVLENTTEQIKKVLCTKAREYATQDRLHNFKKAATLANSTPEMALRGMLAKHIVSVWDLIDQAEAGQFNNLKLWDEKIIDSINYLILLRAMAHERYVKLLKKDYEEKYVI